MIGVMVIQVVGVKSKNKQERNVGDAEKYGLDPWVGKIPWRRKWQPTPLFLPEEAHGQRSLVGYGP